MQNPSSPFDPSNDTLYQQWRKQKLADYPRKLSDLLVTINDPRQITATEYEAILKICRKTNMALYASNSSDDPDKEISLAVGRKFGLQQLNSNWLADDEGVTSITVAQSGTRQKFIPYSNRLIQWHTDGYYNSVDKQIHGLLLHCVRPAAFGGENALLDHEIAYILLRDKNPDYIRALMANDVMTIPARMKDDEIARAEETGTVFSINPSTGNLHMRYTVRQQHVIWKQDPLTQEALAYLTDILHSDSPYIFRGTLQSGMGLVSNNVLHDRGGFDDDADKPRLLYRARYFDRIANCDLAQYNV